MYVSQEYAWLDEHVNLSAFIYVLQYFERLAKSFNFEICEQ